MKLISLILIISGLLSGFCFGQQPDTMVFFLPEVTPSFKYDTCTTNRSSLKKYFMDNYKMPAILIDNGYSGSVYIDVVIEEDGSISNIKLIRGIDEPLDMSVIEKIKTMQKWIPGFNKGKPVRTRYTVPVSIYWLHGKSE